MNKQDLYEQGYRIGAPVGGLVDAASIDGEICTEAACEVCRYKGIEYHPYIRDNPQSYRAFAVCPQCGASFEF